MFAFLFENWQQRDADNAELERLRHKYGSKLMGELRLRASASGLRARDRRHWQRILKKARADS